MTPIAGEQAVALRRAAKEVGRSRAYVRRLIDEQKVRAFKVGGSDAEPWLSVYVSELRAAIDRDSVYVPPAARAEQAKRPTRASATALAPNIGRIHPAALNMRKLCAKRG